MKKAVVRYVQPPPAGMWGAVVLHCGVWFGVAADWGSASAKVFVLNGIGRWVESGRQVADFRHSWCDALANELEEQLRMEGPRYYDDAVLERAVNRLLREATAFSSAHELWEEDDE